MNKMRDGHVHSHYCPHGSNDGFEKYLEKAINMGIKEITFTEHMTMPEDIVIEGMGDDFLETVSPSIENIEKYIKEAKYYKDKYKDKIKINIGLEVDIISINPFQRRIEYYENDISLGFLEYSLIYDRIEIDNFFVEESYRRLGIGTKLLAYLISISIELHAVNITLEVRVSNTKAINLYKKFGFREVALRKYYYGDEDGILMEKQVM